MGEAKILLLAYLIKQQVIINSKTIF